DQSRAQLDRVERDVLAAWVAERTVFTDADGIVVTEQHDGRRRRARAERPHHGAAVGSPPLALLDAIRQRRSNLARATCLTRDVGAHAAAADESLGQRADGCRIECGYHVQTVTHGPRSLNAGGDARL